MQTSFLQFQASHFSIKFNQQIMFFQSRFLDLLSLFFFSEDFVQDQVGAKMAPKVDQVASKGTNISISGSSLFQTLSSRNHNHYCTVGTSWLLKVIISMEIDSFAVLVAFLCALFYTRCSSPLFFKTSVHAQPLSPPFFEEIAAHKKYMCFVIFVFAFCFFYFVHIYVDFWIPLPTSWARLASFWSDFGAIFGSTFPRFPPPALNSCRDLARNLQRTC